MTVSEMTDIYALCSGCGKGMRKTLAAICTVRRLQRHAATGALTGYKFRGQCFDCLNPESFPFLFSEIFIPEPYRFPCSRVDPLIIDGGVNIGLGIAYFKEIYPQSRIIGFEPHPDACRVAEANIKRNGYQNVQLVKAALTKAGEDVELRFSPGEIMGSTIGKRLEVRKLETQTVRVPAVRLSKYLTENVDFMKLDIEGAETQVLEEAGDMLRMVKHMLVDFHITRGDASNSLPAALQLLERNGFDYLLTSTLVVRRQTEGSPVSACGPISSVSIFAKRIE